MSQQPGIPWLAFFPSSIIVGAATLGRVGYWGKAPGTNGSVAGLLLYTVAFHPLSFLGQLLLLVVLSALAVVICGEAEVRMFKRDPGEIILDEVVAVPLVFLGLNTVMAATGYVWLYMLVGFALFRFFDILKPLGINRLQALPGGRGVVYDDLAAALAAALVLRLGLIGLEASGLIVLPNT